jgi:transitional endoplasmic reticulum ATPase
VIISYADMILPAGPMNFLNMQDRISIGTVHRWSLNPFMNAKDNIILLISEGLTDLHPKLISSPKVAVVEVPLPNAVERKAVIRHADPSISDRDAERLAEYTAGLKALQISAIFSPEKPSTLDDKERVHYIRSLLGDSKDAAERALKLAGLTRGMDREEIRHLIDPEALPPEEERRQDPYAEVLQLVHARKREIIEKECQGLIEFVQTKHGFSHVGGKGEIKRELLQIGEHLKAGNKARVPMGLLFVGPMGTGKTFIAGAFAREVGITAVKLKNFRSKWVGETESNLEKVLTILKAMGPIMLIIDEGDRSFGSSGEGDEGTSSRVIARLKEFMSDTDNRGNVLFVLMTNRPDKLDTDIKRAGRLDRKIPFFFPYDVEEIEGGLEALFRRYRLEHALEFPRDRERTSQPLFGYSFADLEAVTLLANDLAHDAKRSITADIFAQAIQDYLPSRDTTMLKYMELLAVFESSNRRLLPPTYHELSSDELNEKLQELKRVLGIA